MRPIPAHSTDLLYSDFSKEDLVEMCNALGIDDIKYITAATLKPERVLYHSCLNGVQTPYSISQIALTRKYWRKKAKTRPRCIN